MKIPNKTGICISRRLINIVYGMLKNGTEYRMPIMENTGEKKQRKRQRYGRILSRCEHRILGVISIFHKDVTLEEVLRYNYPYADGYRGFWENPIKVQHPLAISEIVAWDGSLTLLISKNNEFVNTLMKKMYLQNQPISGCYHYEQGYQNRETEGCRGRFTFLRLR